MLNIVSPANPRFKSAVKLLQRRGRQQQRRFLIDGLRETEYAIRAGIEVESLFVHPQALAEHSLPIDHLVELTQCQPIQLAPALFEQLAYGERRSHVIAVAVTPRRQLSDVVLSSPAFVVVVEGIEKPGNLGAMARTVDAVGADALLVADCPAEPFNPNVIRASMGTALSKNVIPCQTTEALAWLREQQISICAAWVDDSRPYPQLDYQRPIAIVLGSEAHGLSSHWQGPDVDRVCLPMHGIADSLNVSTTAAVLLYEVWRQRQ